MRFVFALVVTSLCFLAERSVASAIPLFAQQYGVTCMKCHSVVPRLNEFGAGFLASGERIPGVTPGPAAPVAIKLNLLASSDRQGSGPDGAGLPKAIVDEVEIFLAGGIGSRGSYFVEQYLVDGGMRGSTRDAWVSERLTPWSAHVPVSVQAGSFTLPLPVDPETFRETYQHYAVFDQTAGANPFNFFDPKIGALIAVGSALHGLSAQAFVGPGHDRQSGLPSQGLDTMQTVHDAFGIVDASVYRYQGARPTTAGLDRFWRLGYGLVVNPFGRFTSETVLQTGWDDNCGVSTGLGCSMSGGFTQVRYRLSRRAFVLARYEGTRDGFGTLSRDAVVGVGFGVNRYSRVTLEDVVQHTPATTHTMNLQYLVAR